MFKVYRTNRYTIYHSIVNASTIHDPSAVLESLEFIIELASVFASRNTNFGKDTFRLYRPGCSCFSWFAKLSFSGCYGPSWSKEARLWNHADHAAGQELWAKMLQGAPRVPLPLQFGKGQVGLTKWSEHGQLTMIYPKLWQWQFLSGKWISESLGTLFSDNPSWSQSCWSISRWQGRASQHTPAAKRESYT